MWLSIFSAPKMPTTLQEYNTLAVQIDPTCRGIPGLGTIGKCTFYSAGLVCKRSFLYNFIIKVVTSVFQGCPRPPHQIAY